MNKRGLTLLEVIAVLAVIVILAALLLPSGHGHPTKRTRLAHCAHNFSEMYTRASTYLSAHKGQAPPFTGEDLWRAFIQKGPTVSEEELAILTCPLQDDEPSGECHYRGPRIPWSQLKANDPIAADKEGNHGEGESINVMLQDGTVLEATPGDALWRKCREILGP